jgi:hypothetical protein
LEDARSVGKEMTGVEEAENMTEVENMTGMEDMKNDVRGKDEAERRIL